MLTRSRNPMTWTRLQQEDHSPSVLGLFLLSGFSTGTDFGV